MSSTLLESVRRSQGLSQTELARRGKTYQANISSIENGITDPGISTLEQCLAPLGYSLFALPTKKPSVSQFTLKLIDALASNDELKAFRLFIQLNNNLNSVMPDICLALCITPPPLTGDSRYDALIAGLIEFHLTRKSLPLPSWLNEPNRKLPTRWIVDPFDQDTQVLLKKTPKAFLRHNVLISQTELSST